MQLRRDGFSRIRYPDALPSLLELMNERSHAQFDPDPLFIESLIDERLFENPILYINCDELPNFLSFLPRKMKPFVDTWNSVDLFTWMRG